MLCNECLKLDVPSLIHSLNNSTSFHFRHHRDYASLTRAVELGCELCRLFHDAVIADTANWYDFSERDAIALHVEGDTQGADGYIVDCSEWGFAYQRTKPRLRRHDSRRTGEIWDHTWVSIRLCSLTGRTSTVPGRIVGNAQDFNLYSEWIRTCASAHDKCPILSECQKLPSRLLEVGSKHGSEVLRLVETSGRSGQYVALSHCWGQSKPPITTRHNYATYLRNIQIELLPRTFQDAVFVTRALGFQHLWVDCFCIIQGDTEDWELECAQMRCVFENAALTIAGPAAVDSDSGFLHPRVAPPLPCCRFETKGNSAGPDVLVAFPSDAKITNLLGAPNPEEGSLPLRTRGWVVQERYLSPRNLYFGPCQTYFECRSSSVCEASWRPVNIVTAPRKNIVFGHDYEQDIYTWYRLVDQYNRCKLTYPDDKLAALSGLASHFHKFHHDSYLAGLWRNDLVTGLQWRRSTWPHQADITIFESLPSWSWAHISGPVSFEQRYLDIGKLSPAISFEDIQAHKRSLDPFGAVAGGRLRVRGRLKHTLARVTHYANRPDVYPDLVVTNSSTDERHVAMFVTDTPRVVSEHDASSPVWCLLLGFYPQPAFDEPQYGPFSIYGKSTILGIKPEGPAFTNRQIWGLERCHWVALALEPVNNSSSTYRRIGVALAEDGQPHASIKSVTESEMRNWFGDCQEQQIDII